MRGKLDHATRPQTDAAKYFDAIVPGEVHLDLLRAGIINEPATGLNVLACRWVEECYWSYRREFDAPAESLRGRSWLDFERLDLAAQVILNGQEIGTHVNSFYPCRIETTGKLRQGKNLLVVHLDGGLFYANDKPTPGLARADGQRLHKRHWLRKPQCQFGWDWAPRLINVGITGNTRLEWTAQPARIDQFVPLVTVSDDLQKGTVRARLFVEGLGDQPVPGKLSLEVAGGSAVADVEIKPGLHPVEVTLGVDRPRLWWPVGHGQPHRYEAKITLEVDGQTIGQRTAQIGFRRVRINQGPHPAGGNFFNIEINGRKIFAKGGNFIPADLIFARIDRARYQRLVELALEANFNFLRVWGGGLYEADAFYDLCDEKGILVWQEFIYAGAEYPMFDPTFFADARREAIWNIRRLAAHPSLVVWCGNNEQETAAWYWEPLISHSVPDHGFYHITLPRLMAEEDPTRYYQASSPLSPMGIAPGDDSTGDQHPWGVGFADTDFRKYRAMICRFPDEGGILGPTSLPTLHDCFPPGDHTQKIGSLAWQIHDNSVDSWGEPSYLDTMITQWLGMDIRAMTLEDFAYWGGLLQGEGLREYCDNFRRRMFDTGAAIFWMYNDTWPASRSWTTIDYALRRTPAFAPVRRAMAPIHVVLAIEAGEVVIFGINDTPESVRADLRFGVFNLAGGMPIDRKISATLPANASTPLARFKTSEWVKNDPAQDASAAFAQLERDGQLLARNRLFLPLFKDLQWPPFKPDCKPTVRLENGLAIFHAETFVWGVCLDLNGEQPLPDNFFDLYPGVPYSLKWMASQSPRILRLANMACRFDQ